jgi:hypothetical protein
MGQMAHTSIDRLQFPVGGGRAGRTPELAGGQGRLAQLSYFMNRSPLVQRQKALAAEMNEGASLPEGGFEGGVLPTDEGFDDWLKSEKGYVEEK